jgi:hypothetical protein
MESPMNIRPISETVALDAALYFEEKAEGILAWADNFPERPLLSDEAVSRESMYPGRW